MSQSSMDEFCGSTFWNSNLTWYTGDPELTQCFEKTVLIWTPCAFLWIFSLLEVYYVMKSRRRNIPYTWKFWSKTIFTIVLIVISFVDLAMAIHRSTSMTVYNVNYTTPFIKIITFSLVIVLMCYNRRFGMQTSGVLFVFWFLLALCGAVQFRSYYRDQTQFDFITYMIYYPIVLVMFLLNFFIDAEPTFSEYPKVDNPCPEQSASFLSKLTFAWFDSMAWKGFRRPLETSDLWAMNPEDTGMTIVPKFDMYWDKAKNKSKNIQTNEASFTKSSGSVNLNNLQQKTIASILTPLCKAFGPSFLVGVILKIFHDILLFVSPQLLQVLIEFVQGKQPLWKGYLYATLLLLTASIQTLLLSQYFKQMSIVGMRIRTALIAAIYRKTLRMSNAARKESTVGEIVNLMSVDAQKFMDLTTYLNMIWSAPLQIIIALYFLWHELGWAVLAGLAVMIILIPVNALIANKIKILQIRQMKSKDERVKLMNEILNGIKVLKLYAWELSFEQLIQNIRSREIKVIRDAAFLNATTSFIWACTPFLVSLVSFATYVYMSDANVLDSKKAFVSLSLFNILRFPLSMLPMVISNIVQASVSVKRINVFMNTDDLDPNNVQHDESEVNTLIIENGSFTWDMEIREKPTLRNINLQVEPRQLVAVVGTVGSGKSSLISAFLGEMIRITGRVNVKGSVAYVSQQAWIQNATMQDNILFGKPMNKTLYARVIEACDLNVDMEMLPAGDQTEIGEKGINLSGGQKQRVALARAVYCDSDIYFLDDPLSAVDTHVGKHIFDHIIGPTGLLKKKTRIMVTHGVTYLPEVDNIVVMKNGEITEIGTYKELKMQRGAFADFLTQHLQEVTINEGNNDSESREFREYDVESNSGVESDQKSFSGSFRKKLSSTGDKLITNFTQNAGKNIIEIEKAETGSVKWRVYIHYVKSIGILTSVSVILMSTIFHAFSIGSNIWISIWSDDKASVINGTVNPEKRDMYVGVYGVLGIGQAIFMFLAQLTMALGCLRSSKLLHSVLLCGILHAPLAFFDTTPSGRVLNRFGKDIDIIDNVLPQTIRTWLNCLSGVIATLFVISYGTPIFVAVILPIGIIYYIIQRFYVASSRQLKRLESISRSPIYSHFGESITGAQIIRAYGVQERFISESQQRVDFNQICYYPSIIANRWLAVRLEMIGNMIIFFAALFSVLNRDTISPGLVGLSVAYALQITQTLNFLVRMTSDVETNIVAVERIKEYAETQQEAPWEIESTKPEIAWPSRGDIELRDFKVRYRDGLDLTLRGITFAVNGGEKIGIVGRTGAGKSSLTLSLFRIIEAADGKIFIDGYDISKLGLHTLRSGLTIIPQDPVLFSGTLRLNLDPFNMYTDEEIWRALEYAHLKTFVLSLSGGFAHQVSEGGENFSVGQRQLICLARALLRKTKILILDEATAAVDLETDDLIQRTIREEFKNCTVLTIAHRLNTILDSDKVIVLDKGYIVEFESPQKLLAQPTSTFYGMAKNAGLL